jgi:hypothetical protein
VTNAKLANMAQATVKGEQPAPARATRAISAWRS